MTALDRPDLHAAIEQRYPDNTNERITPELLRDGLHEIVDAAFIKASDEGAVPNVPLYDAGTDYAKGYTVRYPTGTGVDAFYYSLRAGKLPAPSGSSADVNWKVVPGPVSTAALSQQLTLDQARAIEGLLVVAGREYIIDCGPDPDDQPQLVTVRGVSGKRFDVAGTLDVAGVLTPIEAFDVIAGTWLVPGPKADLGPDGRIVAGQAPGAGFKLRFDFDKNEYAYDDGMLLPVGKLLNTRIDPVTGQYKTVFGWTTIEYNATQGVTYQSETLKIQYAIYQLVAGTRRAWYIEPANGTPAASFVSTAPVGGAPSDPVKLGVSVLNADVAALHIAPRSGYDDAALRARVTALEQLGGRLRGPWAGGTTYLKFDMVVQAGGFYYANATFTSGSSFDASNWTSISAAGTPGGGGPAAATAADVQAGTSSTTFISPQALAQSSEDLYTWIRDVPADVQANVENTANWDAYSRYFGPLVPDGLNGKIHYFMPAAGLGVARYKFEFIEGNQVVRFLISTNP